MTTTFLNLTPHLLNSAALWQPSGQNTSSPPQLLTSSTPLLSGTPSGQNTSSTPMLSGTPSGQNTSSPPLLLNSAALWTSSGQNTSSSPPLLNSSPPQPRRSLAAQVDKILFTSSTLPLSGAPSGTL